MNKIRNFAPTAKMTKTRNYNTIAGGHTIQSIDWVPLNTISFFDKEVAEFNINEKYYLSVIVLHERFMYGLYHFEMVKVSDNISDEVIMTIIKQLIMLENRELYVNCGVKMDDLEYEWSIDTHMDFDFDASEESYDLPRPAYILKHSQFTLKGVVCDPSEVILKLFTEIGSLATIEYTIYDEQSKKAYMYIRRLVYNGLNEKSVINCIINDYWYMVNRHDYVDIYINVTDFSDGETPGHYLSHAPVDEDDLEDVYNAFDIKNE